MDVEDRSTITFCDVCYGYFAADYTNTDQKCLDDCSSTNYGYIVNSANQKVCQKCEYYSEYPSDANVLCVDSCSQYHVKLYDNDRIKYCTSCKLLGLKLEGKQCVEKCASHKYIIQSDGEAVCVDNCSASNLYIERPVFSTGDDVRCYTLM